MSELSVVPWATRRRSPSTSLTISPMPLAATAPTMPRPRGSRRARGSSSPKPATVDSVPSFVEQHDGAVGGDDRVPGFAQRELGHALDVEQRRQLLREAVDQIDLAIEVQHLGTERLALHLLRHQVIEQRGDGPRRFGSAHPAERCPVVLTRRSPPLRATPSPRRTGAGHRRPRRSRLRRSPR